MGRFEEDVVPASPMTEVLTPRVVGSGSFFRRGVAFLSAVEAVDAGAAFFLSTDVAAGAAAAEGAEEGEEVEAVGVVEGAGAAAASGTAEVEEGAAVGLVGEDRREVGVGGFSLDGVAEPAPSGSLEEARGETGDEEGLEVAGEEAEGVAALEAVVEGGAEGFAEEGVDMAERQREEAATSQRRRRSLQAISRTSELGREEARQR